MISVGTILIALGIIGLYIAKIYDEILGRPLYVIKQQINTPTYGTKDIGSHAEL
jgi:hypothetical protein